MSDFKSLKIGSFSGLGEDFTPVKNLDRVGLVKGEESIYAWVIDGASPCGVEVYDGSTEDFVNYLSRGLRRAVVEGEGDPPLRDVLKSALEFAHIRFSSILESLSPPEFALPSASLVAMRLTPTKIEISGIGDTGLVGIIKGNHFEMTFKYLKDEVLERVDTMNLAKLQLMLQECGDLAVAKKLILKDICEARKRYHNTENGYKVLTPNLLSLSGVKFWEFSLPPEAEGEVVLYSDGVEILFPLIGREEGLLRLLRLLSPKEVYELAKSVALSDLSLSIPRFKVLDDFSLVYVSF